MISILIADYPGLLRDGLELLISQGNGVKVIGLANSTEDLTEVCGELNADIILLGFDRDSHNKIDVINTVKQRCQSKILILTTRLQYDNIVNLIKSGVDGCILKDIECNLENLLKTLSYGMSILPQEIYRQIIQESTASYSVDKPSLDILTQSELEIVRLVAQGKSNKEIASIIYISEGTVRNRLTVIYKKLNVNGRIELAVTVTPFINKP
jgi:DNA-binding NarL/FixJ family response regulator